MSFLGKWLPTTCAALALATGCGHKLDNLRTRAAHDLTCERDHLQLSDLGAGSWGVSGCGKQATYILAHTGGSSYRQWVMNSVTSEVSEPETYTASSSAPASGVQVTRGERGNTLNLELWPGKSALRVRLMAKPTLIPDHVLVGFQQRARKRPDEPCEVRVVANGSLLEAPPPKYEHTKDRVERWTFELPPATVAQLASAQRVVAQVCAERAELDADEIAQLAEFMLRFREEQALAGQAPVSEEGSKEPPANTAL